MQLKVSVAMLLVGLALLWLVPLGGALLLVAAGMGLAIAWEADMAGDAPLLPAPAITAITAITADDALS